MLPMLEVQFQSLAGELGPHMPCDVAKKKKKIGNLSTVMKLAESKPKSESRPKWNFLQPEPSLS